MRASKEKRLVLLALLCALGEGAFAGPGLDLDIDTGDFATEFVSAGPQELREARFKSGLGLNFGERLLEIDVDYHLSGQAVQSRSTGVVTQQLQTRFNSALLDSILGIDLGMNTRSSLRENGDVYRHQVNPGFSRRLSELARLKVNYEYVLNKPSRLALEQENRGYTMALDGALRDGRLTWSGAYRDTSVFRDRALLTRATRRFDLKSRYQLDPGLHLEISGLLRSETRFTDADPRAFSETRYGAALGWSPSARYLVALRVDSLDKEREQRQEILGSGSISWFPRPDLELKLDYGDTLVEGNAGWMLHTRFDING